MSKYGYEYIHEYIWLRIRNRLPAAFRLVPSDRLRSDRVERASVEPNAAVEAREVLVSLFKLDIEQIVLDENTASKI